MEFADRLTDTELRSLYQKFAEAENIVWVEITRTPDDISMDGTVEVKLNTGQTIRTEDCYTLTDFYVVAHDHNGDILVNRIYREFMYGKFGNEYAKAYLFRGNS